MKALLRRFFSILFRPVAVAVDPRLEVFENRLSNRMDQLENHVGTDAEVSAELAVTQGRTLASIDERLRRVEEKLDALLEATARR
jgi:hypothetical protein